MDCLYADTYGDGFPLALAADERRYCQILILKLARSAWVIERIIAVAQYMLSVLLYSNKWKGAWFLCGDRMLS
jgi:hypothetical protein